MISIADLSAARSQEPKFMLHKFIGRNFFWRNNTGFPFFCIAIIFVTLSLDTIKKETKTRTMAFHGLDGPNMIIVRYIMDNVWSMARLEAYITSYQPGGPPLHVLRHLLGHGRLPAPAYTEVLSRLASLLFGLGHLKPVNVVVAELLRGIPPGHLTPQQVPFCSAIYPTKPSSIR